MEHKKQIGESGAEARKNILTAIVGYIEAHGYPPTVREICSLSGYKSTSTVQAHLSKMLDLGMIETDAQTGSSRAIRVPNYRFVKEACMNNDRRNSRES